MALQEDTLDDVIHDFGVYTDGVHILFDEDGLSDSDDEDYQQPLQEEATNMLKNLTQRQRQDIYQDLLQLSTNGILQRNSTTLIAAKYNVHVRTIQRVWQRAKNCLAQGIPVDVNSLRPKNCGRKKNQVDLTRVADIPLNRRGTIRSLAYGLQSSKSKNAIHKIMFYSAVGRPRFDGEGRCYFNGLIGIWPFAREVLVILYIVLAIHFKLFGSTIFIITATSKKK